MIRKQLNSVLLKSDLAAIKKEDRFFYYEAFDLNHDNKNEYFIGLTSAYFCGTGGCSGYILNSDGSLINKFTVTDFPILIINSTSEKFQDLIMGSKGVFYHVKMKNGKYPSNPSIQKSITTENINTIVQPVLDIYNNNKHKKYTL